MKEVRYFYDPELSGELPREEAQHVLRVLRLQAGDELNLMDGRGHLHRAQITQATGHRCRYSIMATEDIQPEWHGRIHLAMAPTKNNDRTEWMAEKATEIGCDAYTFLDCQFSERRVLKTDRIEKIVVAAMKQSHKAYMPQVDEMTAFADFVRNVEADEKFICHCYDEWPSADGIRTDKPLLMDCVGKESSTVVLVGPEGDFSIDEVQLAEACGFRSVSLGRSRLRTETAALCAVHMMRMKKD